MTTSSEFLRYLKVCTNVHTFDTGLQFVENIDSLYNTSIRNRVILKLDLLSLSTYFSKEVMMEYRDVIFNILCNGFEVEQMSQCLLDLYESDSVFHDKVVDLYIKRPTNMSFGLFVIQSIANEILLKVDYFKSYFVSREEFVITQSEGYLYISIKDENRCLVLPIEVPVEVVSYAKNWNGQISQN